MRDKERVWSWVGGDVGRIWENLRVETVIRIYCVEKNLFSRKIKIIKKLGLHTVMALGHVCNL